MSSPRNRSAFTLIELLIVVAIIAILAAIAVPNFLEAQVRAKVSRARSDMRTLATALESYRVDNNDYNLNRMGTPLPAGTHTARPSHDYIGPNDTNGLRPFNMATVPLDLTTPIAYISTTLRDPFKDGASERIAAGGAPGSGVKVTNPADQTTLDYSYNNIYWMATRAGAALGFDDTDIRAYGNWRMGCMGPDNRYEGSIGRTLYDPTNGTTSRGDIIRTERSSDGRIDNPSAVGS